MDSCKKINFVSNKLKFCALILDQANLTTNRVNVLISVDGFPIHLCNGSGQLPWGLNAVKSSSGDTVIVQCEQRIMKLTYRKNTMFFWEDMDVRMNQRVKNAVLISLPPGTRCD